MLNDYKGEKPNNVITEEEHKKRPFFKKVSFWVLSALGLFFGGCSVYGLVLGYQYVHAVTEAAHIIADANGSDGNNESDVSLTEGKMKGKNFLSPASGVPSTFDFSCSLDPSSVAGRFYDLYAGAFVESGSFVNGRVYWRFANVYYSDLRIANSNTSSITLCVNDYVRGLSTNGSSSDWHIDFYGSETSYNLSGTFVYSPYSFGYGNGYDEGYDEGHHDGYQEGYDDGSDAINLPQSVKVLLPVGNEYSVQYKSYVDGVVDRQGQLNSSQTGGAYATFDRSRTQKLRIDLTLPSGSRAFFLYTPSWTSAYPTDENYPLRQSWAVSGVTYLPTWVAKPQIYVDFTSADVPDLTYETISVAFDVDHWGDIKVGAYSQGYNDGYQAGEENPVAYDSGYDAGYAQGYDEGHTLGVAQGESQAVSGQKALVNMFVTAFQQPFDQIYRFLNFNVLGLNILALFTALLTLSIGIIIIKKVI